MIASGLAYSWLQSELPFFSHAAWGCLAALLAMAAASGAFYCIAAAQHQLQHRIHRLAMLRGAGLLALAYWSPYLLDGWAAPNRLSWVTAATLFAVVMALLAGLSCVYWLSQPRQTLHHVLQAGGVTGLGMLLAVSSAHLALDGPLQAQNFTPPVVTPFSLICTALVAILLASVSVWLRHACIKHARTAPWHAMVGGSALGIAAVISDACYRLSSLPQLREQAFALNNSVFQPITTSYLWFVMVLGAIGLVCAMAVHAMLSRQQQLRRDLEFKEQQMRVIFQNAIDAIVITDHHGVIQTVNRSFEGLFGFKAQHALGKHVSMLIPEWHAMNVPNKLRRHTDVADQWVIERSGKHANGQDIPLRIALVYVQEHEQDLYVGFLMDMTQFRKQQRELEKLLTEDPLTGLFNRRGLLNVMQSTIAQNALPHQVQTQYGMILLFIDLDGFKAINDQYGHAAGDAVLIEIGQRIHQSVREEDTVCRFGGDEFVVLLKFLQQPEKVAEHVINKITKVIATPLTLANGHQVQVGCSIGVSFETALQLGNNEVLIDKADTAMYQAKKAGGQRVVYFN